MHGPSKRGGAENDAGVDGARAPNSPTPGLSLIVAGGEGRRSAMALWFASAFGDVRGVVGALKAGVSAASLSPLDPCAWWLASTPSPPTSRLPRVSLPQAAQGGGHQTAHGGQASTRVHARRRSRRGTWGDRMLSTTQMRLVSSLHLALRWVRLDAGDLSPSSLPPLASCHADRMQGRLAPFSCVVCMQRQGGRMTRKRTAQHASWWQAELLHTWPLCERTRRGACPAWTWTCPAVGP